MYRPLSIEVKRKRKRELRRNRVTTKEKAPGERALLTDVK
jgi:hypothetical protein